MNFQVGDIVGWNGQSATSAKVNISKIRKARVTRILPANTGGLHDGFELEILEGSCSATSYHGSSFNLGLLGPGPGWNEKKFYNPSYCYNRGRIRCYSRSFKLIERPQKAIVRTAILTANSKPSIDKNLLLILSLM